ncbi:MAG: DUF5714 domain-containing protein [Methanocorpusculum sp.]|nr:DUF5714 domain-containing protein [Methanocorpusculum sp.]
MKYAITKCPICGEEMIQEYVPKDTKCDVCGKNITTNFTCQNDHHLCNDCRFEGVYNEMKQVCLTTKSRNPLELAEIIMDSTNLSLLGCKHYLLASLCVYTAYKNSGGRIKNFEKGLDAIKKRVLTVQTSICKLGGFCGLPLAIGGAFQTSDIEDKNIAEITKIANKISGNCMAKLISPNFEGSNDCCIRNSAICIAVTAKFLSNNYWVDMDLPKVMKCKYSEGNPRCNKEKCRFYVGMKIDRL